MKRTKRLFRAVLFSLLYTFVLNGCRQPVVDVQPTPRPSCLVVRAIHKTGWGYLVNVDPEQITINGKTYTVYKESDIYYTYDEKGKLIREIGKGAGGGTTNKSLTYTPSKIYTKWQSIGPNDVVVQTYLDTISLNAQGYDDRHIYDKYDLQLTYKSNQKKANIKVQNNNLVFIPESYDYTINSSITFDLTRLAVPQIRQYEGIGNKNLITELTLICQGGFYGLGPIFGITYFYEFDEKGRVKREIQLDKEYPGSNWPFGINPLGIGVIDYEYECR